MQTIPVEQSASMIPDGASLMIGGFMAVGTPERLIDEIVRQNRRNLTVIANDTALPGSEPKPKPTPKELTVSPEAITVSQQQPDGSPRPHA